MKLLLIVGIDVLIVSGLVAGSQRMVPVDKKDQPIWQGCEGMKPTPRSDDGSEFWVCTNMKGERFEVVLRSGGKTCTEVVKKDRDTYKHFLCSETYELMVRPEVKNGK